MNREAKRIWVIGLDGATYDLLQPWIDDGHMPILARLQAEGSWGPLRTVIPPITAPAWTSFKTGMNPGRHGIFEFMYRQEAKYSLTPVNARRCAARSLWDWLSDEGKRVAVVNVPMTYPPHPVNGVMVTGLFTPRAGDQWQVDFTYPPELRDELRQHFPDYIIHPTQVYARGRMDEMLEELRQELEVRTAAFLRMIQQEDPDFAMVVYNGTDKIQHALWHCLDLQHPFHDAKEAAQYSPELQRYFEAVDATLGRLLDAAGDNTHVMLMSDHGMGPIYRFIYLNNWLWQQGFLKLKGDPVTLLKRLAFRLGLTPINAYNVLVKLGLARLRTQVDFKPRERLLARFFLSLENVDWSRTQAYSLGNIGQIYLNVRGREPQGIVERGEEYQAVREKIIERLLAWHDPETGRQIVTEIYRREEVYAGPYTDEGADIVMLPHGLEYQAAGTSAFMQNGVIGLPRGNSGGHRMNGIWLLRGAGVQKGHKLENAQIIDLAPTLLYLMELPIPEDMDGEPLLSAFEPAVAQRPPKRSGRLGIGRDGEGAYSDSEADEIVKRLADLGYVS